MTWRNTQVGSLVLPIKLVWRDEARKYPEFGEFYARSSLVLSSSEPGSKELRRIVGFFKLNQDDRARSVRCECPCEPNPRWCSVGCLLPLRRPESSVAPSWLPLKRESSRQATTVSLQGNSKAGIAQESGKDAPLKKFKNGHPSNPLTLLGKILAGYRFMAAGQHYSELGREPINLTQRTACLSPLCTNSDRIAAFPRNDAMGQFQTSAVRNF
jgi:hypothetical protein